MADKKPPAGKKDNAFTRKIGPLPMWVWLAIVAALVLLYVIYKDRKNTSTTNAENAAYLRAPFVVTRDENRTVNNYPPEQHTKHKSKSPERDRHAPRPVKEHHHRPGPTPKVKHPDKDKHLHKHHHDRLYGGPATVQGSPVTEHSRIPGRPMNPMAA